MEKGLDTRQWFVVVARPRAEKQVSLRLAEAGVENYLPLQRRLRMWHDRRKWVEMPLFPSYVFVKTDERLRTNVFDIAGVVKFVTFGGKPAVLNEKEIERIHRLCEWLGEVAIEQGTVKAGDEVEILAGHFKGLHGQVLDDGKHKRLRLAIAALGCVATVEVDGETVRKAIGNE